MKYKLVADGKDLIELKVVLIIHSGVHPSVVNTLIEKVDGLELDGE